MDRSAFILYISDMLMPNARVCIHSCNHTHCQPDWRWEHDGQNPHALLLWMIEGGTARLTVDSITHPLNAGDVFVIPLWAHCLGEHSPQDPLRVPWALFQYTDESGAPVRLDRWQDEPLWPFHRRPHEFEFLKTLLLRSIALFGDPAVDNAIANHWMQTTLWELHRQDETPDFPGIDPAMVLAIDSLCTEIREHPGTPWRIGEMARRLHYSPDHFARLFRRVKGMAPSEFVIRCRIETAKSMLRISSYPIGRIANLLGYGDVYHFSKQFKQKTGVSPRAFQSQLDLNAIDLPPAP